MVFSQGGEYEEQLKMHGEQLKKMKKNHYYQAKIIFLELVKAQFIFTYIGSR